MYRYCKYCKCCKYNISFNLYKTVKINSKKINLLTKIASQLYVPLNIFIALVGVVVWNEKNEAHVSSKSSTTLENFVDYRRKILLKDHPNDNAQLLTKEPYENGVVGFGYLGTICSGHSGGISADSSEVVSIVASIVAHEMGHNLGMQHDASNCTCFSKQCIMFNTTSSEPSLHWSSCSIDQLNLAFDKGKTYCLK